MTSTQASRIHRGFHRIGIVFAIVMAVPWGFTIFSDGVKTNVYVQQFAFFLLVPIVVYILSRALGWIIAGFAGE